MKEVKRKQIHKEGRRINQKGDKQKRRKKMSNGGRRRKRREINRRKQKEAKE